MKVGGVEVTRCEEVLVLPRINGDLVFKAVAVESMDYFDEICPRPKPPVRLKKGGVKEEHLSDEFVKEVEAWSERRYAYIVVKSLEPSDIEWEGISLDKPSTWSKWADELRAGGLSDIEVNRVQSLVLDANSLNEVKLKAAREAFLLGQGADTAESFGHQTTPQSTQSGQPANE